MITNVLQLFSEIEVTNGRIFYKPLFPEIEENNYIGKYKLGDNTTHLKKVSKTFHYRKTGDYTGHCFILQIIYLPEGE